MQWNIVPRLWVFHYTLHKLAAHPRIRHGIVWEALFLWAGQGGIETKQSMVSFLAWRMLLFRERNTPQCQWRNSFYMHQDSSLPWHLNILQMMGPPITFRTGPHRSKVIETNTSHYESSCNNQRLLYGAHISSVYKMDTVITIG